MTISKTQKIRLSIVTATESERQLLRDLYNACVDVSEDNDVYESLEEILGSVIEDLIRSGISDFSSYYDD